MELPTHATIPEIKQAYRRLAMIYHPDKNENDPYAPAKFSDIKEAYEVLTNPLKRESWLQERWYNQSIGKKKTGEAITPVSILKLSLELEKYVSRLDVQRMSKEGLVEYVHELLSTETVAKLMVFNEEGINRQIITTILTAIRPLPLKFARHLVPNLKVLAGKDDIAHHQLNEFLVQQKKIFLWDRYKMVVVVIVTLLICLLILLTTK